MSKKHKVSVPLVPYIEILKHFVLLFVANILETNRQGVCGLVSVLLVSFFVIKQRTDRFLLFLL